MDYWLLGDAENGGRVLHILRSRESRRILHQNCTAHACWEPPSRAGDRFYLLRTRLRHAGFLLRNRQAEPCFWLFEPFARADTNIGWVQPISQICRRVSHVLDEKLKVDGNEAYIC